MHDRNRQSGSDHPSDAAPDLSEGPSGNSHLTDHLAGHAADNVDPSNDGDDTLFEEIGTLIDDGSTYVQAEIAFQKSRAKFAGRTVGVALVQLVLAVILLHIAFLALAVGLVIALTPLVTVWGAIAIVFGGLLLIVAILVARAVRHAKAVSEAFASDQNEDKS